MTTFPATLQEILGYAGKLDEDFGNFQGDGRAQAEVECEGVKSPRRIVYRIMQEDRGRVSVAWECWNGEDMEHSYKGFGSSRVAALQLLESKFNEPLQLYYKYLED